MSKNKSLRFQKNHEFKIATHVNRIKFNTRGSGNYLALHDLNQFPRLSLSFLSINLAIKKLGHFERVIVNNIYI